MPKARTQILLGPQQLCWRAITHPSARALWWPVGITIEQTAGDPALPVAGDTTSVTPAVGPAETHRVEAVTSGRSITRLVTTANGAVREECRLAAEDGTRTRLTITVSPATQSAADRRLARRHSRACKRAMPRLAETIEHAVAGRPVRVAPPRLARRSLLRLGVAVAASALLLLGALSLPLSNNGADDPQLLAESFADAATDGDKDTAVNLYADGTFDAGMWRRIQELVDAGGCVRAGPIQDNDNGQGQATFAVYPTCTGAASRDIALSAVVPIDEIPGSAVIGPGAGDQWVISGAGEVLETFRSGGPNA